MTSARVWHGVMAVAMVAMLVLPAGRESSVLQLLLFSCGLAWCASQVVAGAARGVHLRLGAGFVAMAVMLAPAAFGPASAAMPGMPGMAGMHESHAGLPTWLSVALLVVMLWSCWPEGLLRRRGRAECQAVAGNGIPVVEWHR